MKNTLWIIATSVTTFVLLSVVQTVVKTPLLLGDRLIEGGGWVQIILMTLLAGWLYMKMSPRPTRGLWRRKMWIAFSIIFFGQLLLGIAFDAIFLMTGTLHFPIPGLIPTGAVYRWQLSFMPILFLVTIFLSGGAWCSQLCYFGAFDSYAAKPGKQSPAINTLLRQRLRLSILSLFLLVALCLRLLSVPPLWTTLLAASSGLIGIGIILFFSRKKKYMVHCTTYCPAGTLVVYLKKLSPWRFRINPDKCTHCMACSRHCLYGALQKSNIQRHSPGLACTQCGDCLPACHHHALEYRFATLSPAFSEKLWLCVNLILFICFLAIARI